MVMQEKKLRVLAVADGMIPSVELVLAQPLAWLAERGHVDYSLQLVNHTRPATVSEYDLLIVMRSFMPDARALAQAAVASGVPVIYAIDDDFETVDPTTTLGRYLQKNRAWERVLDMCTHARQVWAFSEAIRQKIRRVQPHVVIPPAIASIETIDRIRATRGLALSSRRVIGYGASKYHRDDLAYIAPVLRRILDEHKDVELQIIGVSAGDLASHPRVQQIPAATSVEAYYELLAGLDWTIGLAPLLRSPSNDAKTDNKYREYAAFGIPAVYSDAPPFERSLIDGYNGLVADSLEQWHESIKRLLKDEDLRCELAANARLDVQARYSLEAVSLCYFQLMRTAMSSPIKVVAYAADLATTEIDIVRPLDRLQAEGRVTWRHVLYSQPVPAGLLEWADIAILSRLHDSHAAEFVERATRADLPLVYSWDDDFFGIPDSMGPLAGYHKDPLNLQILRDVLAHATLVKASSDRIAARSREYTDQVVTHPYGFDFAQLQGTRRTVHADGAIRIGFFGGAGHSPALENVVEALQIVARREPRVCFEFFGPRTERLAQLPRSSFIAYEPDAEQSLRTLASRGWDIGLAPLEINDFNSAKLPTKYRDYSACHIAGIYTRIEPYRVVSHGVTGLLVENNCEAWVDAVMRLVTDAALRRSIAARAHAHVRNALSLDQAVEGWRQVFDAVIPEDQSLEQTAAKQARRLRILETRVADLAGQVDMLRTASRALLEAQLNPLPPAGSLPGRVRRRAMRWLREMKGATPVAQASVAIPELALGDWCPSEEAMESSSLRLGPDLRQIPYAEYPLAPDGVHSNVFRLPTAALVPTLGGQIGIELVTPDDEIHAHVLTLLEHVDSSQVASFEVGAICIDRPGWRVRCFARNAISPVHLLEWHAPGKAPTLVYRIEAETTVPI